MSDNWKKRELKVARFFGTERNPLSGQMAKHSSSDTLHPRLFIDNRHRKSHSVISAWDVIKAKAQKEGKTPVLTLTQHNRHGFWVVIHSNDLAEIMGDNDA